MFKEKALLEKFFEKEAPMQLRRAREICRIYDKRKLEGGEIIASVLGANTREDLFFQIAITNCRGD